MKINYCLPIIKNDKEEIFKIINENKEQYQYFEIWLDYVDSLNDSFITQLISLLQNRLILLFRRQNLDPITITLEKRLNTISVVSESPAFLDIDISEKEELAFIAKSAKKPKLILSYHNYQSTPIFQELEKIITEMEHYQPTIYKIATMCENEDDAFRLMQLLLSLKKQNKKYIVLGMGKFGTITRVFGTIWGNEIVFAPQTLEGQSAEGQLTKEQLDKTFTELTKQN